eukprot:CAMPEP_0115017624 /NCGR_PEP_ID=MMETSP0216-20121206/28242_1 /TAXON_ID=223996 /ORGANISM="Protocruzia adherens, Strain Boccale" /LENGTH=554 /DNA_ID=CAMNT_0002388505 /DNA_START=77 /DNA_END=1737 /DNA_ORIENTATION=+
MGSQITKNYDMSKEPICSGGPRGVWKIHKAVKKDRTRQEVAIFILNKKGLDKIPKSKKEEVFTQLRREAQELTKLRHPRLLNVIEPLIEDKNMMAFVTEPLDNSLHSLLGNDEDVTARSKVKPSELEMKLNILDVVEGITFLHNDAKIIHLGISPENIYVTQSGKWKISGFSMAVTNSYESEVEVNFEYYSNKESYLTSVSPNLVYTAPELTTKRQCSKSSDLFSLGSLLFTLFKFSENYSKEGMNGEYNCVFNLYEHSSECHVNSCRELQRINPRTFDFLPDGLRPNILGMLEYEPSRRMDINQFKNSAWFNDNFLKTLIFLERIDEKDETAKQQFLGGLAKIIKKFDSVVIINRILPRLLLIMQDEQLSTVILPSLIQILEIEGCVSKSFFQENIWPPLKRLCSGKEIPAQALYIIVCNLDNLIDYLELEQLQDVIMPLMFKAYECEVPQLQEQILGKTPCFVKKVEYTFLKTKVLPRVLFCVSSTKNPSVRIKALFVLKDVLKLFDRTTVNESILPVLEKVKKVDSSPEVCMHLLKIYESISESMGYEITA